mmetsp:Transcript_6713/g.23541  ORF Transcript_6713/g.23541 Transcript_6713/m.23541 type:complete len:675 (-) Transcript_6713:86-2110(-)
MGVLYDRDHYKLALGQLNTCKKLCESVARDYVRLMKYADSLYRCKSLKVAALGRMMTLLKRQKASLAYLEEVRKHLGRLPALDPTARTLLVCGFPNVGKSSFMNKVTNADVEVQPYAFTTKSLYVGHMDHQYLRWQVIDTPGILDHELEKRNVIEMQAVTALAHLPCAVLYFVDISEQCGYTIAQQASLYESIRALFADKQLIIVANKTDVRAISELPESDGALLEAMRLAHRTNGAGANETAKIIEMSNVTETGVSDVKNAACELLLAARVEKRRAHQGGERVRDKLNRLVVATPKGTVADRVASALPPGAMDDGEEGRDVSIPASVRLARTAKRLAKAAQAAADLADRAEAAYGVTEETAGARPDAIDAARKRAEASRKAAAAARTVLDRVAKPLNPTERDLMWQGGGPGVYSADWTREYIGQLKCDEWRSDMQPEIMDGKNILDFVDEDIAEKLAMLEEEETETDGALHAALMDEAAAMLSPQEAALIRAVREKKVLLRKKAQAAQGRRHAPLPAKVRIRAELREMEDEDDADAAADETTRSRARSAMLKRGRSASRGRAGADDAMDEGEPQDVAAKKEARAASRSRDAKKPKTERSASRSRNPALRPAPRDESCFANEEQRDEAVKIAHKMQKKINLLARAGEADRWSGPKLVRWTVEGKMPGLGTRNCR